MRKRSNPLEGFQKSDDAPHTRAPETTTAIAHDPQGSEGNQVETSSMTSIKPSEAEQEAAFQVLEAQFCEVRREFDGLQAKLCSSETHIQGLNQACKEKDASLEELRGEHRAAMNQIQNLQEQVQTGNSREESLQTSIEVERTRKEVAEELAKGRQEALASNASEMRQLQRDAAQLRGALSRTESTLGALEDDHARLGQQVGHLTSELASLRHAHLKEKMKLEQQISENGLKWETGQTELKVAQESEKSLRDMLKRMEEVNGDLMVTSSSQNDLWMQKECELQKEMEKMAAENTDLKAQMQNLVASNTDFQSAMKDLEQRLRDTEKMNEETLRDAHQEVVAARKQLHETSTCGPRMHARRPGLSALSALSLNGTDISQEMYKEFSLESVRNLSSTDLFIEFSNLLEAYRKLQLGCRQKCEMVEFIEEQQLISEGQRLEMEKKLNVANQTCDALRNQVQQLSQDCDGYAKANSSLKDELRSASILKEVAESSVVDLNHQVCDLLEEVYRIKSSNLFFKFGSVGLHSRSGSMDGVPRNSPAMKNIEDLHSQNRQLKEALLKAKQQVELERADFQAKLEKAGTEAKCVFNAEMATMKRNHEQLEKDLSEVQKQNKEEVARLSNDLAEAEKVADESQKAVQELPAKLELVEQLERELKMAKSSTAMAETQCSMHQTLIKDLQAQLDLLQKDKESTSTILDHEKRSSASLQVTLQGSETKKIEMEAKLAHLEQLVSSRDSENMLLVSSREAALKKVEDVVCTCEQLKGELHLCENSKKQALEMVQRLEYEVQRWRNLNDGRHGDSEALASSMERMQTAAASLEADLRSQLQEKDEEITKLSETISANEKGSEAKDKSIQALKSEVAKLKSSQLGKVAVKQKTPQMVSSEMESLRNAHVNELAEVKKDHALELAGCISQHAKATEAAAAAHVREFEAERKASAQSVESMKAAHARETSLLKKKVVDLYKETKRLEEERKAAESQLAEIQEQKAPSTLLEDLEQKLGATRSENARLKVQCEELQARVKKLEQAAAHLETSVPKHMYQDSKTQTTDSDTGPSRQKDLGEAELQKELTATQNQLRSSEYKLKELSAKWEESVAQAQRSSLLLHQKDAIVASLQDRCRKSNAELAAVKSALDSNREEVTALKMESAGHSAAPDPLPVPPQPTRQLRNLDELREAALTAAQDLLLKRKSMDESDQAPDSGAPQEPKKAKIEKQLNPMSPSAAGGDMEDRLNQTDPEGQAGSVRVPGNESPTSQTGSPTSKDDQEKPKYTPIVFAPPQTKPNPRTIARGRRGNGRGGR